MLIEFSIGSIFLFLFLRNLIKLFTIVSPSGLHSYLHKVSLSGQRDSDSVDATAKLMKRALVYVSKYISKLNFLFSESDNRELEHKLKRVNSKDNAERFRASQILNTITMFGIGLLFFLIFSNLGIPFLKTFSYVVLVTFLVFGIYSFTGPANKLKEQIEEHNNHVIEELPRLASTYINSPAEKDIVLILEDYLDAGKSFLEYDIKQLLAAIREGEEIGKALDDFAHAINLSLMTDFVTVLKTAMRDKRLSEINMKITVNRIHEEHNKIEEKRIAKIEEKLKLINMSCSYTMFAVIFVPMLIYSAQQLIAMMK